MPRIICRASAFRESFAKSLRQFARCFDHVRDQPVGVEEHFTENKAAFNVNELTQLKALERLAQKERIQKEVREIIVERKRLENALKFMPFVKEIFPSEANFVLVRVDQADQSYAQLLDQGIVVRNRSKQLHCENTLRFTIGTPNENNTLIETLNKL